MGDYEAEVGGATEAPAPPETADVGVGGWDVGDDTGWAGPSPDQWAQTQQAVAQQQEALAYIAQLLIPQEEQAAEGPDPFADNFQEQLAAYVDQRYAPIVESYTHQQQEAAYAAVDEQVQGMIRGEAAALGVELDAAQVAQVNQAAMETVEATAVALLRQNGYMPHEIEQLRRASSPQAVLEGVAKARGQTEQQLAVDAVKHVMAQRYAGAKRPPGPDGVLVKYTRPQQPSRQSSIAKGGPSAVLAKHRRLHEGRRS
jgi:hypothetical protein